MSVSGSNKLHFLKSKNHEIFRVIYISCIFVFCLLPLIFLLVNISSSDITKSCTTISSSNSNSTFTLGGDISEPQSYQIEFKSV